MDPFSIFFVYFLRNSNVFYPSIAFIVITKDNFSCEQKSGFLVNVKHEKSVKVFWQHQMGVVIVPLVLISVRTLITCLLENV